MINGYDLAAHDAWLLKGMPDYYDPPKKDEWLEKER